MIGIDDRLIYDATCIIYGQHDNYGACSMIDVGGMLVLSLDNSIVNENW